MNWMQGPDQGERRRRLVIRRPAFWLAALWLLAAAAVTVAVLSLPVAWGFALAGLGAVAFAAAYITLSRRG